jgi:hypothetical protein
MIGCSEVIMFCFIPRVKPRNGVLERLLTGVKNKYRKAFGICRLPSLNDRELVREAKTEADAIDLL